MAYWLWILGIVNLSGMILTGVDKRRAIRKRWRIPEKAFFLLVTAGGSLGIYAGCLLFRHKTKHMRFMIGIPVMMILQVVIILYFLFLKK